MKYYKQVFVFCMLFSFGVSNVDGSFKDTFTYI